MKVVSYSDDAFLNFGIQQLLNTPQKETRVCRIGHVAPGVNSEAEKSLYFSLSDNELFILLALSMGIKPELLTRITGRSEKRISAIKRNVMNKLEIRNGKVFYSVIKALFIHDANNSSDSRAAILTVKHEQLSSRLL